MKTRLSIIIFISISCTIINSKGQDAYFSQFHISPLYTNPSNAGTGEMEGKQTARFGLQYRNHFDGLYKQTAISYDQKINKLHGGIGASAYFDNSAFVIQTNTFGINYALHSKINNKIQLNSGIGIEQSYTSASNLYFYDITTNNYITIPNQSIHYPNMHIGSLLLAKNYYFGVAIHNIIKPNNSFFKNPDDIIPVRFTLYGRYIFQFNKFSIAPQILYQQQAQFKMTTSNVNFKYKSFIIGIGGKVTGEGTPNNPITGSLIGNFGYQYRNFKFMFDYESFSALNKSFLKNSMEFSLIYSIKTKKESPMKFLALY